MTKAALVDLDGTQRDTMSSVMHAADRLTLPLPMAANRFSLWRKAWNSLSQDRHSLPRWSLPARAFAQALDNNVGLMACENTMRNTKVGKADMYGGISYVDAGVVHLMKRQREGWAYIRP